MDLIHHWLLEQRRKTMIAEKNLTEDDEEVLRMLNEPIPGITREDRMDQIEGESFGDFMKLMAG